MSTQTSYTGKNFIYVPDSNGSDILNGQRVTKIYYGVETEFQVENGKPVPGQARQIMYYYVGGPGDTKIPGAFRDIAAGQKNWNFGFTKPPIFGGGPVFGAAVQNAINSNTNDIRNKIDQSVLSGLAKHKIDPGPLGLGGTPMGVPTANRVIDRNSNLAPAAPPASPAGPAAPSGDTPGPASDGTGTITPGASRIKIAPPSGLVYPEKLKKNGIKEKPGSAQDVIQFEAQKLKERTGAGKGEVFEYDFGDPSYESVDGPVFLPIQSSISDQNSAQWSSDTVDPLGSVLYHASLSAMNSNFSQESVTNAINTGYQKMYSEASKYKGRIQRALAGQAASLGNILARTDNVILNPNMELLFNSPQLRTFNFQFKLSAREKTESDMIKKIIKYFKYHSAVRTEDKLFLKSPDVFSIRYLWWDGTKPTDHPGIGRIKKVCALTNFSVDYTPLGSYMTYNDDGTMVSYTLNMQFQEIIPIYDTDYVTSDKNPYHSIGF